MITKASSARAFLKPLALLGVLAAVALTAGIVLASSSAVLVKDINPGSGGSGPSRLTDVNGTPFSPPSAFCGGKF